MATAFPDSGRQRWAMAAAVLVAHLALLWLFQRHLLTVPAGADRSPAPRLRLEVWLTAPPRPMAAEPRRRSASAAARAAPARAGRLTQSADPQPSADPERPVEASAAAPPALTASSPADTMLGLDPEATRRAIRASALSAGPMAQQAVQAGAALRAPTAEARLPGAMERSGRGDCAKGEFAGGGMGLLSLPFLAAAAINGECAK